MSETFLILLASGIWWSAAIAPRRGVTTNWFRLAGFLALAILAGSVGFFVIRGSSTGGRERHAYMIAALLGAAYFVSSTTRQGNVRQILALCAATAAMTAGAFLLRDISRAARPVLAISVAGIAFMTGLVLMDMLLGHAYLTAHRMTLRPFLRLNRALAITMLLRAIISIPGVLFLQFHHPIPMLWGVHGLLIVTRWLVGLALPGLFVYMAHDCIKRRATQSATGILYVTGLLIFIGELISLWLVSETGLPF